MKEATGELNMTVVTVVAIAAVAAFFYAFIWPGIKNTIIVLWQHVMLIVANVLMLMKTVI